MNRRTLTRALSLSLVVMSIVGNRETFAQSYDPLPSCSTMPLVDPAAGFDQASGVGAAQVGPYAVTIAFFPWNANVRTVATNKPDCQPKNMGLLGTPGYPSQAVVCGVAVTFGNHSANSPLNGIAGYPNLFVTFGGNDGVKTVGGQVNYVVAGAGDDIVGVGSTGQPSAVCAYGGDGIDMMNGSTNADVLSGNGGGDSLFADGGDNVVFGGPGDDNLYSGYGDDRAIGGSGDDVIHDLGGTNVLNGDVATDLAEPVDCASGVGGSDEILGGFGSDAIAGCTGNDVLNGFLGDDLILGGPGADVLMGDLGNDQFWGGDDADILDACDGADDVSGINGESGNDTFKLDAGTDLTNDAGAGDIVETCP